MEDKELVNISWFTRSKLLVLMDREELYTKNRDTGAFVKMPFSKYMLNAAIHLENVWVEKVKVGAT